MGFLVKCMASRLQTNNELSSLFQRKKKCSEFPREEPRRDRARRVASMSSSSSLAFGASSLSARQNAATRGSRTVRDSRFLIFFFPFLFRVRKNVCVGGGILVEIRFARVFFSAMWGRETRVIATFWFGFVGCGIGRVIFNQLWWILSFGSHRTRARNSRAYPLIFFIF